MPMRTAVTVVALMLLMIVQTSCGPTARDVLAGFKDRFDATRTQFAGLAASLPPVGSVTTNACSAPLDPAPLYDDTTDRFNTEIVMEAQLRDPDAASIDLDLRLSDALLRGLQWTGPKNPLSDVDSRVEESFSAALENALGYRYLVVNRPVRFLPPKAADERTFSGGVAELEGFLFDLRSNRLLCSFRYAAKAATAVSYEYKVQRERDGSTVGVDDPRERLEAFAYSTLWSSARESLARILTDITKGVFVFG